MRSSDDGHVSMYLCQACIYCCKCVDTWQCICGVSLLAICTYCCHCNQLYDPGSEVAVGSPPPTPQDPPEAHLYD